MRQNQACGSNAGTAPGIECDALVELSGEAGEIGSRRRNDELINTNQLALGLITPETAALHGVAPGAGAGGVGIEGSPPATHFVTFAGVLESSPADTMSRLRATLDLRRPAEVRFYSLETRPCDHEVFGQEEFVGAPPTEKLPAYALSLNTNN